MSKYLFIPVEFIGKIKTCTFFPGSKCKLGCCFYVQCVNSTPLRYESILTQHKLLFTEILLFSCAVLLLQFQNVSYI